MPEALRSVWLGQQPHRDVIGVSAVVEQQKLRTFTLLSQLLPHRIKARQPFRKLLVAALAEPNRRAVGG